MFGSRSSDSINWRYSGLCGSVLSERIRIIVNTVNIVKIVKAAGR
jgi:hypothetical protein